MYHIISDMYKRRCLSLNKHTESGEEEEGQKSSQAKSSVVPGGAEDLKEDDDGMKSRLCSAESILKSPFKVCVCVCVCGCVSA